ncbi:RtcB family protein [Microcoleus sp. ARI1-B5]|uniref:RtcB family protein n=1 Tax=unclassified Microcoleus TaxID=2642155 RepID=UPI002FCF8C25
MNGDIKWALEELVPNDGTVRDGGLVTIGGGNHFVEIQAVEEVVDRATAYTQNGRLKSCKQRLRTYPSKTPASGLRSHNRP